MYNIKYLPGKYVCLIFKDLGTINYVYNLVYLVTLDLYQLNIHKTNTWQGMDGLNSTFPKKTRESWMNKENTF